MQKKRNEKGGTNRMLSNMLSEYIGKQVTIFAEGELGGFQGTVVAVEDNWLKIEEKKAWRLVNADMITQIHIKKGI